MRLPLNMYVFYVHISLGITSGESRIFDETVLGRVGLGWRPEELHSSHIEYYLYRRQRKTDRVKYIIKVSLFEGAFFFFYIGPKKQFFSYRRNPVPDIVMFTSSEFSCRLLLLRTIIDGSFTVGAHDQSARTGGSRPFFVGRTIDFVRKINQYTGRTRNIKK